MHQDLHDKLRRKSVDQKQSISFSGDGCESMIDPPIEVCSDATEGGYSTIGSNDSGIAGHTLAAKGWASELAVYSAGRFDGLHL